MLLTSSLGCSPAWPFDMSCGEELNYRSSIPVKLVISARNLRRRTV